jgi:hypothetical protein
MFAFGFYLVSKYGLAKKVRNLHSPFSKQGCSYATKQGLVKKKSAEYYYRFGCTKCNKGLNDKNDTMYPHSPISLQT